MKKITVIGATGNLAVPVIKELVAKGVQVKAIVRDIQKAKELPLKFSKRPYLQNSL